MKVKTLETLVQILSNTQLHHHSIVEMLKVLAAEYPDVLEQILDRIEQGNSTKVPMEVVDCVVLLWRDDQPGALQRVPFIKRIREMTGLGLKESKDLCDFALGDIEQLPAWVANNDREWSFAHQLRDTFRALNARRSVAHQYGHAWNRHDQY